MTLKQPKRSFFINVIWSKYYTSRTISQTSISINLKHFKRVVCIFIWKCVLSGFPDHLYLYLKIYFFQVFLIMINIVLFSSDGLLLEQPETASAAQTYFLLFLHRRGLFDFPCFDAIIFEEDIWWHLTSWYIVQFTR